MLTFTVSLPERLRQRTPPPSPPRWLPQTALTAAKRNTLSKNDGHTGQEWWTRRVISSPWVFHSAGLVEITLL
jgi:hypothetical protein